MFKVLLKNIISNYTDVSVIDSFEDLAFAFQFENCTLSTNFGKYKIGDIIPCLVVDLESAQLSIVSKETGAIEEVYNLLVEQP